MANQPLNPEEEVLPVPEGPSFGDILSEFEHAHAAHSDGQGREGHVVAVTADYVVVNIGLKMEGVVPVAEFGAELPKAGDTLQVSITGRNSEGYYLLSRIKVARPKDWSSLEAAFNEKRTIAGMVTAVIKGGLSVDVGVRAFMPASRSGARDAAEMEQLVGKEISCRIIKLDTADEDVVVDRRAVLEEEERQSRERRYLEIKEGDVLHGKVRSLADYGAFVDIGGVDGLLHVADIAWGRIGKPADVLKVGDEVDVQVLKVDPAKRRISLSMKQLTPDPWTLAAEKYKTGDRARGAVTRTTEFGAFVALEPGVEGLIHLSELSWSKKVRKASDVVKPGDSVDVVILGVNAADHRIALGLKQALGDPWEEAERKYAPGTVVEAPVTSIAKFGAFVDLGDGIEGMIHVGDLSAEKRIEHPQEVLKTGQTVRAVVLSLEKDRRRIRLGVKQLQPTSVDEYIAEHHAGDVVTGRVARINEREMTVELGDGVFAACPIGAETSSGAALAVPVGRVDVSSAISQLAAKWKQGAGSGASGKEGARTGQIRSFRIVGLDAAKKKIELESA